MSDTESQDTLYITAAEANHEDLHNLYNLAADFADNVASFIEQTPALKTRFDEIYDSDDMSTLDEAYLTCSLERIFGAKASAEAEQDAYNTGKRQEFEKQIFIDEIQHYDLYIKFCHGDDWNPDTLRVSTPKLHELSPPLLKAEHYLDLLKKVGAHNIAQMVEYQAPALH